MSHLATRLSGALLALFAVAPSVLADTSLPTQAGSVVTNYLQTLAEQRGLSKPDISVTVLPPRQPVEACPQPFDIKVTDDRHLARILLNAHCPGGDRTVTLVARASIKARIPVAARDIPAGEAITASDLALDTRNITSLTDLVTRPDEAIGKASRRALRARQVLQRKLIQAPELVRRGQTVQIVASTGQIQINSTGVALDTGSQGDVIRVRNSSSGKIVSVRITAPGTVAPLAAQEQRSNH